jgi:RNA polymerase sigma factor (sigma-70 family)
MPRPSMSESLADRAAAAFRAYLAGDGESMGLLIDLLTPLLWQVARGQRLDAATAEDVVQTAWLRLIEHAQRLDDPQSVMKWLIVTARRESWRVIRQGRAKELPQGDLSAEDVARADPTWGTEERALAWDEQRRLWQHISRLPERCRALLRVIAFAERPDYASIAEALGMPLGSIGPTRGRCLAKLRAALQQDGAWGGELA